MKKLFLICVLLLLLIPKIAAGETPEEQLKQKEDEIKALEQKISDLQSQAKTLGNQITSFNSQIKITQLKISQTEDQIKLLAGKIDRLEVSLGELSRVLENRISQTYRTSQANPLMMLVSSNDLTNFLLRFKYLQIVQGHDRKLITQVAQTQSNYQDQKTQQEQLNQQLQDQKRLLNQQIIEKQRLLDVTKNDEKKYQSLLAAAIAEQEAIRSAMSTVKLVNGTPINKGDVIALIGNSGSPKCSSGAHLHFEVLKNGARQDPSSYLRSVSVTWDNSPDSPFSFTGNWDFPIESPRITQGYGMTYWARLGWYGGGPHTGVDMVSDNPVIHAPESGTVYKGTASCRGIGMNYVAVDHGDGLVSWYWHVR